jgi:signal transduction histidine kinase
MKRWGPVTIVVLAALAGALSTLIVATFAGMSGEILHLVELLVPAVALTVIVAILSIPLLSRASVAKRFVAVALIGVVVAIANLGVLAALMLTKPDALLIAVLVGYSGAAGVGAALALSRSFRVGIEKLVGAAEQMGDGKLETRVGPLPGGPELEKLASTLNEMAERIEETITSERRALRVRDDLITAISHDLRTPLAGLRAMVEAIDDGVVDDTESFRKYAAEMRRSVDALVSLVDDLFELVQLDAGTIRTETARASLSEVVHSALAACGGQATEKGILVETLLNGAENTPVSPRMTRVLQNLLQNAIRHTPADGSVRIHAQIRPEGVEVAVEDTGEGIPESALGRVFDPFWRGDEARSQAGSGLGLALAKRIAHALGGDLTVESSPGAGSRFSVIVPARGISHDPVG